MNAVGGPQAWRPGASRWVIEARARLLSDIRQFFASRKVLEVETPVLSRSGNSDPNIVNLATDSLPHRYLRSSPEYFMKRMLASGSGAIYELGRVFRANEKGRLHNPEFTLLEWYRNGVAYLDLASEVCDLVVSCGHGQFDGWPVEQKTYRQLFLDHTGLDPFSCDETDLSQLAAERGIQAVSMSQLEWLDLILSQVIEPALPGETLTIVHDFMPEQAALSRIRPCDPPVAERFEIYLGQMELANGYQELTDADEQLTRFEYERKTAVARGEEPFPLDHLLIEAIRHGLGDCSGVALGVDRLLMSLVKLDHIDAVLAFSDERS